MFPNKKIVGISYHKCSRGSTHQEERELKPTEEKSKVPFKKIANKEVVDLEVDLDLEKGKPNQINDKIMNLETFIAICEEMEEEFAKSMRKQGMYITKKKKNRFGLGQLCFLKDTNLNLTTKTK